MAVMTMKSFAKRFSDASHSPLLAFKWHCVSLPFKYDTTYVETVSLPFPSINVKPVFEGGRYTNYPGFLEIAAFDITFYEDTRANTKRWLKMWQEKIRHPVEGYYYLPGNYKRDMIFELLNTKGDPVMRVKMKNCWPTTSNNWELSSASERLTIQQNFSTDGMEYLDDL